MGQSTNAILFYGFCWDSEGSRPWTKDDEHDGTDDENWQERFARLSGLREPDVQYPARQVRPNRENGWNSTPKDYSPAELAIIEEWRAHWNQKTELVSQLPVQLDSHCSGECPMPYLYVVTSRSIAYSGDMVEVTNLDVKFEWNDQLRSFCKMMGINVDAMKPGWFLVSDWQ